MIRLIIVLVLLFLIGRMVWRFMYGLFEGAITKFHRNLASAIEGA